MCAGGLFGTPYGRISSMNCFLNFSNHTSSNWSESQRAAAESYGTIEDMSFPPIDSRMTEEEVLELVSRYLGKIKEMNPAAVMCQGEFTFTFALVNELIDAGIKCVAACSRRMVKEYPQEDGTVRKEVKFEFDGFREYRKLPGGTCDEK